MIKQCLRKGMEEFGVPKELYFDNGKDYREKSFNKDFPLSLTKQLGINQIYATPYHGQAKPIERFWETLEDRFCKFFYLEKDAKKLPEDMRVTFEKLKDKCYHGAVHRSAWETHEQVHYTIWRNRHGRKMSGSGIFENCT